MTGGLFQLCGQYVCFSVNFPKDCRTVASMPTGMACDDPDHMENPAYLLDGVSCCLWI